MKHYAVSKYVEWLALELRDPFRPETRREIKRGYRGRERAALKRELRRLVIEES